MTEKKEIALMYSGGLDTTYIALNLAEKYEKVHLLTFCNGICLRLQASGKHVSILREKFGEYKFEHIVIPVEEILAFLKKGISRDMSKYHSPLLFDACCRLSMEVAVILYCLDKGIKYACDASNPKTQGQMFIQQKEYLGMVDKFFAQYGIQIDRSYKMLISRDEISRELKASGVDTGARWLKFFGISTQLFTQPFCLWAPVAFLFTSGIRKLPFIKPFSLSLEKAILFRSEKEILARKFIDYLKHNHSLSYNKPCVKKVARILGCFQIRVKDENSSYKAT
jgi:hypothetical protein